MVQAQTNMAPAAAPAPAPAPGHRLVGAKPQYVQKIPGDNSGYYDDQDYLTNRVLGAAVIGVLIAVFRMCVWNLLLFRANLCQMLRLL